MMNIALSITLVGLIVVFTGLGGLALFIYINSKLFNKQIFVKLWKKSKVKARKTEIKEPTADELAAISLAIYLAKMFEKDGKEILREHKTNSSWFLKSVLPRK